MNWTEGMNVVAIKAPANQRTMAPVMAAMAMSVTSVPSDDYKPDMVDRILRAKAERPVGRFSKDELIQWLDTLTAQ